MQGKQIHEFLMIVENFHVEKKIHVGKKKTLNYSFLKAIKLPLHRRLTVLHIGPFLVK